MTNDIHTDAKMMNASRPARHDANAYTQVARTSLLIAVAAVLLVLASLLLGCSSAKTSKTDSELEKATVVRVVDGDTIVVDRGKGNEKLRLIGLNAPESVASDESRNCSEGTEASNHLKSILPKGTVVYLQKDTSDTDQYDRLLRYVWLDQPQNRESESEILAKMLNAQLVAEGWAQAKTYEPDTAYSKLFSKLQSKAKSPFSSGRTAKQAAA